MSIPFDRLFPSQQRVISSPADKLLVLAGPGTGKTEVLTHRVIHLIANHGALPQEILAVTFSRKATKEMQKRVADSIGILGEDIRISTLHAESLRLIHILHGAPRFYVSDSEARLLMQDAIEDSGFSALTKVKKCQDWVRLSKAENLTPDRIFPNDNHSRMMKTIYDRYEQLLRFNRAADLDSIVGKAVDLLSPLSGTANHSSYIRYLMVDEYQDINECEHKLIHLLARTASKTFFVGDDDQSIYSFRGAKPSIIRGFQADFQGTVDTLEESTRCTNNILRAAVSIVRHDSGYVFKALRSAKGDGSPVQILLSSSENSEAFWVGQQITRKVSNNDWRTKEIAIICKRPDLADPVVQRLRREGIDSVFWKTEDILRDEVVRDIVAFLRIILDPEDNLALRICLRTRYSRGIGDQAISRLRQVAERTDRSLWQIAIDSSAFSELRRWRSSFERFVQSTRKLVTAAEGLDAASTVELVSRNLGTRSRVSAQRLQSMAKRFSGEEGLSQFVDELHQNRTLDLAGGTPEPTEEDQDGVSIMTMHGSKGLGFDIVFILGMENGGMPSPNQEIDEQRRLLHVAMTRAKNELYLCASRRRIGPPARGFRFYSPSVFLDEIPTDVIVEIDNTHA